MRNLFYSEPIFKHCDRIFRFQNVKTFGLVILFGMLALSNIQSQCLSISKTLVAVAPATSGVSGNIDVSFDIEVRNANDPLNCGFVAGINVIDDASIPSSFGTAFVRAAGPATLVYLDNPALNKAGVINLGFTGIAPNHNLTDGSGYLFSGERVVYRVVFEINPRAVGAPATLDNTAAVAVVIPAGQPLVTSAPAVVPSCWANCQMACNNSVTVSVNSTCEADILAEMILEGENADCAALGFYQISITYNNQPVNLPLGRNYIGKKLIVSAKNIVCGNSCWGNLILEDKTPPALQCRPRDTFRCNVNLDPVVFGFPVDPSLVNTSTYPYVVTGVDACGSVTLTYKDQIVNYGCDNRVLSATVYRKWCAKDAGGYETCCTDTIDLQRGTIADITLPPHFDGQPGNENYLKCDGKFKKFATNGLPDTADIKFDSLGNLIGGTGRPSGIFCGNIQFDFSDDTIKVCNGTYKLLRKWLIIDWCDPNNRVTYIQLIKVVDEQPPIVICPTTITISTNAHSCYGSYILPVPKDLLPNTTPDGKTPYVLENCSTWTYSVTHRPAVDPKDCTPDPNTSGTSRNITRMADGRYRVDNLQLGCNWIYYNICDECGNCQTCTFDILVEDQTPPVAVCQQKTVVSLTSDGLANVAATVFNQGSNDNCEMGDFKIRRMNPGSCPRPSLTRGDSIQFCCSDIARNPIRIILTVYDKAGNSSECMADVEVQDKLPPRVTCPRDTTVYCETDLSDLRVFGNATAVDNCNVRLTTRIEYNLNNCNIGTIRRWFIGTDDGGRKDSCFQTITVIDTAKFRYEDIIWPSDYEMIGCRGDLSPDVAGKPIYNNRDKCNQIIANYKDIDFNFVEGVCHKILRTWTVIDWCQYDAHNPNSTAGYWSKVQVIKVSNKRAPDFTSSCADRELCITSGCSVLAQFTASATDDCTSDQNDLLWSYKLDRNNDGSFEVTGGSRNFSANLTEGTHRVSYTVSDLCGNSSTCSYLVRVRDCKPPTPYCNTGIVTVVMPSTRNITIWAKDFNLGSFDNCTDTSDLKFSFSANVNDISKIIRCEDIRNGREEIFEVSIYVTDEAGNQDECKTRLIVQDNQDVCPNSFSNEVAGLIKVSNNSVAPGVMVKLVQMNDNSEKEKMTNDNGQYAFADLSPNMDYKLTPSYDEDVTRGVSTKDIVAIQKHILALDKLSDPYKLIAADVNKSESITARDISDIRKLILGISDKFENNTSWVFVDAQHVLDPVKPFNYPDFIQVNNLNSAMMNNNFVAVKIGDVTGEAGTGNVSSVQNRNQKNIGFEISAIDAGITEIIKFPVYANSDITSIDGFQMDLTNGSSEIEVLAIESGVLTINDSHYRLTKNGFRMSWNVDRSIAINAGDVLFYITVRANDMLQGFYPELMITKGFNSELYSSDGDYSIQMLVRSSDAQNTSGYELYQNVPNPFNGSTVIHYKVPASGQVKISLFDVSGKQIQSYSYQAQKGLNSAEIRVEPAYSGIIYYQLETNDFIATRKMVVIK